MKIIRNPHTETVKVFYGLPAVEYQIPAGGERAFPESQYDVVDHFLTIYGFLELVKEEKEVAKNAKGFYCRYCGKEAKSKAGIKAHERACSYKSKPKVDHSKNLVEEFGNTDGVSQGKVVQENIGGRPQKMTYDRDGVGWYGEGLQEDFAATSSLRVGRFN